MSNCCCPPVVFGTGAPVPPDPPCLSADPDNGLSYGTDGCLYAQAAPTLAGDPCNAAQHGADGLLVPRTELEGVAPGGNTGTERSVDIDIVHTEGCPDSWTIGARLTPASGVAVREPCEWIDVSDGNAHTVLTADLPEAGTYWLDANLRHQIDSDGAGGMIFMYGGFFDATQGAHVSESTTLIEHVRPDVYSHSTTSLSYVYTVTEPTTVELRVVTSGTAGPPAQAQIGCDGNGRSRLSWAKVAD